MRFDVRVSTLICGLLLLSPHLACVRAGFELSGSDGRDGPPTGADGAAHGADGAAHGIVPGNWVLLESGSFSMGSPVSEPCREGVQNHKETLHHVTLTRAFEMSSSEVTQDQFKGLRGYNPSSNNGCGPDCPVENLTWHEAIAGCNALSALAELEPCFTCAGSGPAVTCTIRDPYIGPAIYTCPGYRLPTEAEWEYAYRAGTNTAFHNGVISSCQGADGTADAIAWYSTNAQGQPHAVQRKQANTWGLYDMAGNVREWCYDGFMANLGSASVTDPVSAPSGTCRVERGGSFEDPPANLRAAGLRNCLNRTRRSRYVGFRCVRTRAGD